MSELRLSASGRAAGWTAIGPYFEKARPWRSLALGHLLGRISPRAPAGATLTTRSGSQDGIDKKTVTAFGLAFLV